VKRRRSADARSSVPRASRKRLIERAKTFFNHRGTRAPLATKGADRRAAGRKTVAIPPQRVDGLSSLLGNTAAIAVAGELVARISGVARKGAAELASAPDERDVQGSHRI
jgi:hypothetical protein